MSCSQGRKNKMGIRIGDEFSYNLDNDILEVKLVNNYKTYFKGSAPIRNKKKLKELLKRLEDKGLMFGIRSDWFD